MIRHSGGGGAGASARSPTVRGSFTIAGKNGVNTFTFRGRVGGQTLPPGAYRLSEQATDLSRNRSVPKNQRFRIVR